MFTRAAADWYSATKYVINISDWAQMKMHKHGIKLSNMEGLKKWGQINKKRNFQKMSTPGKTPGGSKKKSPPRGQGEKPSKAAEKYFGSEVDLP